jgi:DNA-binding transcriptional ArsR family regulator
MRGSLGNEANNVSGTDRGALGGLSPGFLRAVAAQQLKALGHCDRLRIIELLARGPLQVGAVAGQLGLPLAAASRHLRVLHRAQVVVCSRRGNHRLYALADREVARLTVVAYRCAAVHARRLIDAAPKDTDAPRTVAGEEAEAA